MSNRYKVLLPLVVHTKDDSYKQGEEFDNDFTPEEETANVKSGLLEIVPQKYEVVGGSRVYETDPGGTFEAALPIGQEALLVDGGHIKRVKTKETKTKKK